MVAMVRGGQGKSEKSEDWGKLWNFTFQSQGKCRGFGKVREFKSTSVQKLTKMREKNFELLLTVKKIFLITLLADYLYLHF